MRAEFGVVVPIRTFALANTRLSEHLSSDARAALAVRLADTVLRAAATAPVVIVTSAPDVEQWARGHDVAVVPDPGSLDAAAEAGVEAVRALGLPRAVVSHADLPFATTFAPVTRDAGRPVAVLVPCQRDDGTPVLSVPTHARFAFAYGPGSFRRHVEAARTAGLAVRVVRDPNLGFDVDTVDDLRMLAARDPGMLAVDAVPS
jgi:2-phospho-L-lactate/phosphoenolpyruvate guanylyltransferase